MATPAQRTRAAVAKGRFMREVHPNRKRGHFNEKLIFCARALLIFPKREIDPPLKSVKPDSMLHFTKMNGAGNDFVMIDNRKGLPPLERAVIARLCDRHRGIGADGLIAVEPAREGADFRMRYYNSDGGEAEMCGNGARCFARYAGRLAGRKGELRFETIAGVISATFSGEAGELVTIGMSDPHHQRLNIPLALPGGERTAHFLNTGVPHAVIFAEDLDTLPVTTLGAAIRHHETFAPKGTNVNFIRPTGHSSIDIRTYERGVEDETLACGTGVVASALVFHQIAGAQGPISVRVRGGETLRVDFEGSDGVFTHVRLTGPADFVFEGTTGLA